MTYVYIAIIVFFILWFVYDKYIQRSHQLLINYPIIGRGRYLLEALREPFRQYFGSEDFYQSSDKVSWVYKAAKNVPNYKAFSPDQPFSKPKFLIKHALAPLNTDEVEHDFSVTFGEETKQPFKTNSVIGRSAMSDGAISPEGTRAFAIGAKKGNFPINTGEGSLTTNFLTTLTQYDSNYCTVIKIEGFNEVLHKIMSFFLNKKVAISYLEKKLLPKKETDTFIYDREQNAFFRPNWESDFKHFPKKIPEELPDIIFQMSSGLYGVRDENGEFSEDRYKKTMAFCKMTEIKLAQGAKQTGGKLLAEKVSESIAYYRGIEAGKSVFSPNRFPFAKTAEDLCEFVGRLKKLSGKPVGVKIVISSRDNVEPIIAEAKKAIDKGEISYPSFINVDGANGGSGTAPVILMERVGISMQTSIYLVDKVLKEYGIRDKIKIIAAGKILNPDDVIIASAIGADFVGIARGFMMSAGCIRARMCHGLGGHVCPVGLATQDISKRRSFLVFRNAGKVANYHHNLLEELKVILAIMGVKHFSELNQSHIQHLNKEDKVTQDIAKLFDYRLDES